jgi:poly(3-hydroxybutyrate) depolymerase
MRPLLLSAAGIALAVATAPALSAQTSVLDDSIAPGANYDKAQFRFWSPSAGGPLRAVLVLVPGSNGDGRSMAQDTVWQAFATRNRLAIVACRFTDKPHDQSFIENYVNVGQGSGQALVDAITRFAQRAEHPELATAPLLFWGMSAGGEFNYEFAAWKPERVAAFVVNKGGIYYTMLASRAAREVPALLFIGGKDLDSRVNSITGIFSENRRGGALWALTEEPSAAHIVGRSRDLSIMFFDDVLPLRLGTGGATELKALSEQSGYLGDFTSKSIHAVSEGGAPPNHLTAWLPTMRIARAWQAVVTETPFEK